MRFKRKTIFENWIFDENPITLKHRRCTLRISVNKKGFIISHQSTQLYVPIIGILAHLAVDCNRLLRASPRLAVPAIWWWRPETTGNVALYLHGSSLPPLQSVVEPVPASWTQLWSNIHWVWWCDLLILKCVHVWLLILNMFFTSIDSTFHWIII